MNYKFGAYTIMGDEIYFLAYAGGKRELPKEAQKNYDRAILLPWEAQRNELKRLGQMNNPNVVPVKGNDLITLLKDHKWTPFFDKFFEQSHMIQVNDVIIYESMKAKSYDIAMGK